MSDPTALEKAATVLVPISEVLNVAGEQLGGVAGIVLRSLSAAARLASDVAASGRDPIEHIERIHKADPSLKEIRDGWKKKIDDLWRKQ